MTTISENINEKGKEELLNFLSSTINGNCFNFAIAMHRNLGWSLVGLIDESKIIHAGVKTPEGEIWDGRGKVSKKEFGRIFTSSPFIIQEITEEELLATEGVKEHGVELILKWAQLAWPNLPWKKETIQEKMINFADELEELSRKHGLWIGGITPTELPVIFQGLGDEVGYRIRSTLEANAFTINRIFEF